MKRERDASKKWWLIITLIVVAIILGILVYFKISENEGIDLSPCNIKGRPTLHCETSIIHDAIRAEDEECRYCVTKDVCGYILTESEMCNTVFE